MSTTCYTRRILCLASSMRIAELVKLLTTFKSQGLILKSRKITSWTILIVSGLPLSSCLFDVTKLFLRIASFRNIQECPKVFSLNIWKRRIMPIVIHLPSRKKTSKTKKVWKIYYNLTDAITFSSNLFNKLKLGNNNLFFCFSFT